MSHKAHSAAKLIDTANTPDDNLVIALLGDAVLPLTPQKKRVLRLVGLFDKYRHSKKSQSERALPFLKRECERLFFKALLSLDAQLFRDFADVIEAARRVRQTGAHSHEQAAVNVLADEHGFQKDTCLLVTKAEFKKELDRRLKRKNPMDFKQLGRYCDAQGIAFRPGKKWKTKKVGSNF